MTRHKLLPSLLAAIFMVAASFSCINNKGETPQATAPEETAVPPAKAPPEKTQSEAAMAEKALRARLQKALDAKGPDYKPRTEHFNKDGSPKYLNRLILENSPYLLQHAHNPVDWRPWGDEAFEAARAQKRPVFLSVGYATCHWCHVMERESFEDEEIAAYINANYIAIKVDRERRPDVDSIYMKAVRLMSGGNGGWPMTVIMTPDREPFFGGTYFPARTGDRGSRKGFFTILQELKAEYTSSPDEVVARAKEMTQRIQRMSRSARPTAIPGARALVGGAARLGERFDPQFGGFGKRPKFPRPVALELLLQVHRRTKDPEALRIVTVTLRKMAEGGVYDHIGGGFHRYSVDRRWLVPHFEKMLYDNAQLASIYLDAWQITGEPDFVRVTREILDYVALEMTDKNGAFYSATDADSVGPSGEQEEGYYFSWTPAEVRAAVSPEEAKAVEAWFGISPRGNFEHGRTLLHTWRPRGEVARELGITPEALTASIASARPKLYKTRARRAPPLTDDKILVGWNGLMISAYARAGFALSEPTYTKRAVRAGEFLWRTMFGSGGLSRVYKDGLVSHRGALEDYAFFAAAALDLFEATGDSVWFDRAVALHKVLEASFWDTKDGGYFLAHVDTKDLMVREKPTYDGAVPTGNSVALRNLLRLYQWTGDEHFKTMAEKGLAAFGRLLDVGTTSAPKMATALDFYLDSPKQIVLIKPDDGADASAMLKVLGATYLPNRVVVIASATGAARTAIDQKVSLVQNKTALGGKVTAYVCEANVCKRPTSDPKVFARQIAEIKPFEGGPFEKISPK